ncbi:metallophosphoesterase [Bacillus horti]|uniref:Phosphodiesterase n=1 Tax=Caldalkalibacillus horti TaxID=77523 RepID=A0ABT9W4M7_9BACI|nr:metallophosphoesterase [Bacillus horti]MDQ0168080.1 putative phosphodiesterase [Bacillus horti]
MRIYTISDLHLDYKENQLWLHNLLEQNNYERDLLILAGDITDNFTLLEEALAAIKNSFREVFFVPGNHDLWIRKERKANPMTSFEKFHKISALLDKLGIKRSPFHFEGAYEKVSIIPLLGWYDYSFGSLNSGLRGRWMDFFRCDWDGLEEEDVTAIFIEMNKEHLPDPQSFSKNRENNSKVITFSHFVPRLDLMPTYIPAKFQAIFPLLGSYKLEEQIRYLKSDIHVFGHTHLNMNKILQGIQYVNNAFGYPYEHSICRKELICIYDDFAN